MNKNKSHTFCVLVLLGLAISAKASDKDEQNNEIYLNIVEQTKVFICEGSMVDLIGEDKEDCKKNVSSVSDKCKQEIFKKLSGLDFKNKYREVMFDTSRCLTTEAMRLKKTNQTLKEDTKK